MYKKTIFIITRYSILISNMKGIRIARESSTFQEYKKKLFDKKRLNSKYETFKKITVRSLISQYTSNDVDIVYLVLISDQLPIEHRKKIEEILKKIEAESEIISFISIVSSEGKSYFKNNDEIFKDQVKAIDTFIDRFIKKNSITHTFATVRLDDDDALAASYCQTLSKYLKKEFAGYPITFPYGVQGKFDRSCSMFNDLRRFYWPNIALGLALVNHYDEHIGYIDKLKHIYRLGDHTKIPQKKPVIYECRLLAFFRTITGFNSSAKFVFHNYLPKIIKNEIDPNEFAFLKSSLQVYYENAEIKPIDKINIEGASKLIADQKIKIRNLEKQINQS